MPKSDMCTFQEALLCHNSTTQERSDQVAVRSSMHFGGSRTSLSRAAASSCSSSAKIPHNNFFLCRSIPTTNRGRHQSPPRPAILSLTTLSISIDAQESAIRNHRPRDRPFSVTCSMSTDGHHYDLMLRRLSILDAAAFGKQTGCRTVGRIRVAGICFSNRMN